MSIDENIKSFIAFINKYKDEELLYVGSGGVLVTKGCKDDPTFGGCCSKQFDLLGLIDDLEELINE